MAKKDKNTPKTRKSAGTSGGSKNAGKVTKRTARRSGGSKGGGRKRSSDRIAMSAGPEATEAVTPVNTETARPFASTTVLAAVADAATQSIDPGDTVEALVPLLSVQPLPPVVIPAGARGRVTHKDPVGSTTGYLVEFNMNGALRTAAAFSGQIVEIQQ